MLLVQRACSQAAIERESVLQDEGRCHKSWLASSLAFHIFVAGNPLPHIHTLSPSHPSLTRPDHVPPEPSQVTLAAMQASAVAQRTSAVITRAAPAGARKALSSGFFGPNAAKLQAAPRSGARLLKAAPVRALFSAGQATKGSIYDYTVKVGGQSQGCPRRALSGRADHTRPAAAPPVSAAPAVARRAGPPRTARPALSDPPLAIAEHRGQGREAGPVQGQGEQEWGRRIRLGRTAVTLRAAPSQHQEQAAGPCSLRLCRIQWPLGSCAPPLCPQVLLIVNVASQCGFTPQYKASRAAPWGRPPAGAHSCLLGWRWGRPEPRVACTRPRRCSL